MSRGVDAFVEWVDELARVYEEREKMLRDVAARGLTPPKADDTPVTIRWACPKPTDTPYFVLDDGMYRAHMPPMDPGFGSLLSKWLGNALM